jgi:hypothetical protein
MAYKPLICFSTDDIVSLVRQRNRRSVDGLCAVGTTNSSSAHEFGLLCKRGLPLRRQSTVPMLRHIDCLFSLVRCSHWRGYRLAFVLLPKIARTMKFVDFRGRFGTHPGQASHEWNSTTTGSADSHHTSTSRSSQRAVRV